MTPQTKQPEREALAAQIEAFKRQGGQIQRVPIKPVMPHKPKGVTGPYSTHEARQIKMYVDDGYTIEGIALALGRTPQSVKTKAQNMGLLDRVAREFT